jgi:hypothetical protein
MFTQETWPNIPERPPQRRSYLLRCQESRSQDTERPSIWRFSLQDSQTGEQQHFADLESLLTFLQGTFDDADSSSGSSS